jgi:micrococcal nuclease
MKPAYLYSAVVDRVIDGDTIDCTIDLGFNVYTKERFRLFGIDTPEKTSKIPAVHELAVAATKFTTDAIEGKSVTIESMDKDKYGRWLGKIHLLSSGPTINEQLVSLGLAKAYFGDNKENLGWETK